MEKDYKTYDLSYTQNRELSWLQFDLRVLEEAENEAVPLLERLRFASIFTTNLDEFFMVRVGSLFDVSIMTPEDKDNKSGLTPAEQLSKIYEAVPPLLHRREKAYERIMKQLDKQGITEVPFSKLKGKEAEFVQEYFDKTIRPLLSPQIIDRSHPFPHLKNKALYGAVLLRTGEKTFLGIVGVPEVLPPLLYLPTDKGIRFLRMEEIILGNLNRIFKIYIPEESAVICVTRNADISFDADEMDEDGPDYREHMSKLLRARDRLAPVWLEVEGNAHELGKMLAKKLGLKKYQVYYSKCPAVLSWAYRIGEDRKDLLYPPFTPQKPVYLAENVPMKTQIRQRDVLLFYPYHSMQPFLDLLKEAARDRSVVSISITLYRLARNSQVAKYLVEAAENGKNVTVLVELRARFDEKNNIEWAKVLEEAGCRVVYGQDGFKCHSKICLITYQEKNSISYITQVGTGNYNEKTAGLYTDFCLMSADEELGRNAAAFFANMLIGNLNESYSRLLIAPYDMKRGLLRLIDNEIAKGENGRIIIKTNSVTERDLIDKLKEASCAGVQIDLIVRGICCILPGVPGKTEHIHVTSIVGRFLEHSRVYCFGNGDLRQIYISSADIMTRNQQRRVEIACPILSREHRDWFSFYLEFILMDNTKARELTSLGTYVKKEEKGKDSVNVQQYFIDHPVQFARSEIHKKSTFQKIVEMFGKIS
ncbi:polyphosphate kinase 1 [Anaerotignum sp.]